MKVRVTNRSIFVLLFLMILVFGSSGGVFADTVGPNIEFSGGSIAYNDEMKLLRFNLTWSHPHDQPVTVMYCIDDSEPKEVGRYENQNDQVIAHLYLDDEEGQGSVLNLYAVDTDGNESAGINYEFQTPVSSSDVKITDETVPLSYSQGTWSLINLFLTVVAITMAVVSSMVFVENRNINRFKSKGKIKSIYVMFLTCAMAAGNIAILLITQNLNHEMVMFDDMTVTMILTSVLSVITTMFLMARAFGTEGGEDVHDDNRSLGLQS